MQECKIIVQFFFVNSIVFDRMKTLLVANGNQFRFLKARILNITGLRPTLIAYYIFDTDTGYGYYIFSRQLDE